MLVGERTGETYGLGDRLRVKLVEADTATGGLLFDLSDVIERVARHGPPRGSQRKRAGSPPRRPVAHARAHRDKASRRRR
jgi:ribonuclease R